MQFDSDKKYITFLFTVISTILKKVGLWFQISWRVHMYIFLQETMAYLCNDYLSQSVIAFVVSETVKCVLF